MSYLVSFHSCLLTLRHMIVCVPEVLLLGSLWVHWEHRGLFCTSVSQPYWTVARIVVKSLVSHRNHLLLHPSLTIHTFHPLLIGLTSHCMSVFILGQNIYHLSHRNIDNISPLSSSLSSTLFLLFFFYFLERNNNAKNVFLKNLPTSKKNKIPPLFSAL